MKKYRTFYNEEIEEIEISKETEKSVYYMNGERHPTMSAGYYAHFATWEEARAFLASREENIIDILERQIKQHQETLHKIERMKCK